MSLVHTLFFLSRPPSCPSSSVTMGKVCFAHDTLRITDDDSTTQDDKSPPPCLQLRDGVGFFPLFFFKSTNDDEPCRLAVVICLHLHPRQPNNPPTRLQ